MAVEGRQINAINATWAGASGAATDIDEPIGSPDTAYYGPGPEADAADFGFAASIVEDFDTVTNISFNLIYRDDGTAGTLQVDVDLLIGGVVQGTTQTVTVSGSDATYNTVNDTGWNVDRTAAEMDGAELRLTPTQSGMPGTNAGYLETANMIVSYTAGSGDVNIDTNVDALTLTENAATVNAETNVQANVDALTLTENTATVNAETNVQTNVDSLTLSTFSATVNAETNVSAGVDSLTLTAFQATASLGVVVSANVDALTLTEFAAGVNAETSVQASVDALTLTANQAGVNAETNVAASSDALTLATLAATVSAGGGHPVVKITRLSLDGYGVKRAGSFAGKTPSTGAGPHNPGTITRLSLDGYGVRRATFIAKTPATGGGPHNPGKITRLSLDGYGARRAGSFAGKGVAVTRPPKHEGLLRTVGRMMN